jgi:hypothetical protein
MLESKSAEAINKGVWMTGLWLTPADTLHLLPSLVANPFDGAVSQMARDRRVRFAVQF